MKSLTAVMYHYVRDLERSRFPRIKGLTLEKFRGQIEYLRQAGTTFVRIEDVLDVLYHGREDWPEKAALLTFDDGYSDHYRYVFPILDELGIQGCFFPTWTTLRDRGVMDVNKIHFTLATVDDVKELVAFCLERIAALKSEFDLEDPEHYLARYRQATRLDDADTILVKRLLQQGLPLPARERITSELFRRFVTEDEAAFAEDLYLSPEQVKTMSRAGMYFGSHCVSHRWLDTLDAAEQHQEMAGSLPWLTDLGYGPGQRVIAYPYGGFNETTLEVAREVGFDLAFTTEVRAADLETEAPLRIPRLDTIDLPFAPEAR